jgi:hypothetical protein
MMWYAVVQLLPTLLKDRWQSIAPANESRKWPALCSVATADTDHSLVLMLGSSRTCWALRAGSLDGMSGPDGRPLRVYNFGIPSTGPIHEWLYVRDMLDRGIRPRLLLVEFLPPLLCEPRRGVLSEEFTTAFPWMSARQFARMMPYLARPGRKSRDWFEAQIAPWYTFRAQMHADLQCSLNGMPRHPFPDVDEWGWRIMSPKPLSVEERERNVQRERAGYKPNLGNFRMGAGPKQALHDLLARCQRERIPVALVLMPESSEIRDLYTPEATTATRGLLDELNHRYNAPIIDANCWVADEDFEDGHHVLAHGAEVFTTRLGAELPRLLARLPAP